MYMCARSALGEPPNTSQCLLPSLICAASVGAVNTSHYQWGRGPISTPPGSRLPTASAVFYCHLRPHYRSRGNKTGLLDAGVSDFVGDIRLLW